ncbi:MAG: acyl-ACP thioesterase domain-containing protein [Clostridiaceae bacterium]
MAEGRLSMEPVSRYIKKYNISLSDVDFTKHLKLSTLFGYFQDIASMAVENLGIGIDVLGEKFSLAWILMRIRVDIIRNPVWNEEITVETWPQQPKKLEFERDYIVKDAKGNILIRAVSIWFIIDIKTRELRKSELLPFHYPPFITERAIDCKLGKLRPFGQTDVAYKRVIGYSDVDLNGHLNNSRYVDFIMDCFTVENHKKYGVKSFEINYMNEAMPGDTLVLHRDISALDSNWIYIEGVNEAGNKPVFNARIEITAI